MDMSEAINVDGPISDLKAMTYGVLLVTDTASDAMIMLWSLDDPQAFIESPDAPIPTDPPNAGRIVNNEAEMFELMDILPIITIFNVSTLDWEVYGRPEGWSSAEVLAERNNQEV